MTEPRRTGEHMITTARGLLNVGLYTPSEAAFYARVSTQLIQRWLWGSRRGEAVVMPQLGDGERIVSFLDLVQTLAIRAIRTTYEIPLSKIREAVNEARRRYDLTYPFAVRHRTFVFGDLLHAPHKANVLIRPEGIDEDLVQVSGREKGNKVFAVVAELHMRDLYFGDDQLANAYVAWKRGGREIRFDPRRQFGDPMVGSTGYSVQALWHAYVTEGGVQAAAEAYGVEPEDVEIAIDYFDHLRGPSLLRGTTSEVPV